MTYKKDFFKSSTFSIAKLGITVTALAAIVLPAITQADTITRYLSVGSTGSDVSSVQTFLAADPSLYPQGLVTGYYGGLTKNAVANFQTRNGISAVGAIGPITLPVINAQMNSGMTSGADRRAPSIGFVNINAASTNAVLSWNTDENAAGIVYYSTMPITAYEASEVNAVTIGGSVAISSFGLQTSHSATLANLQSNTTYFYIVYVRDGLGNESVTTMRSFHTAN